MTTAIATTRAPLAMLHARFLSIVPTIHSAGSTAFRALPSAEDREDALAESVLAAWRRFLRAVTESVAIDPVDLWAVPRRLRLRPGP